MLTLNQVRQICRKVPLENMGESDDGFMEDLSGIVYRTNVFECGDASIIDRHIDIEYSYGEYFEIHEDASLFQLICTLCNLPLLQEEKEIIIYQRTENTEHISEKRAALLPDRKSDEKPEQEVKKENEPLSRCP